jgi:hypothetical protein
MAPIFRESVRRKSRVVYFCAAVMLFCRVAVDSKTAALQHRNTATLRISLNAYRLAPYALEAQISNLIGFQRYRGHMRKRRCK